MSVLTHSTKNVSQLPFFCSSNSLIFYLDDSTTFSQVLTLYNPYEFSVCYKVLCTASRTYSIAEPQGEIYPQHSVDIIVRLLDTSSNQNVIHKIRIQYFDRRKPQDLIGKRDITCTLLSYNPLEQNFDDKINNSSSRIRTITTKISQQEIQDPLVVLFLIILSAICTLILILPTISDDESSSKIYLPSYLHMTTNFKVVASYILGLLTVIFIRR
ncbi:unnamed protein product [Rotaria sordida]|uniref:MSP domain-containing protein n=1 Tax=Rotaria sordida TaxID=392033 RepID=A0A814V8S9_9BILA|nr:unnamed protein product [Rotaria sordida]